MAKLTKAQRQGVRNALYHLDRAMRFIYSERTQVATQFGGEFLPIAKEYGSDLTGLPDALKALHDLVTSDH